jgi:hypothetical protein
MHTLHFASRYIAEGDLGANRDDRMLGITLLDSSSGRLAAMPERLRDALSGKAAMLSAELQAKIQEKLSGGVLNARTGALARSIAATIDASSTVVSVRIATSGDIKYAAIQEFGGTIPPHEIVSDKAKALAFIVGGKQVFAARVHARSSRRLHRSALPLRLLQVGSWKGRSSGRSIGFFLTCNEESRSIGVRVLSCIKIMGRVLLNGLIATHDSSTVLLRDKVSPPKTRRTSET